MEGLLSTGPTPSSFDPKNLHGPSSQNFRSSKGHFHKDLGATLASFAIFKDNPICMSQPGFCKVTITEELPKWDGLLGI